MYTSKVNGASKSPTMKAQLGKCRTFCHAAYHLFTELRIDF
jgi:hypothetical protein